MIIRRTSRQPHTKIRLASLRPPAHLRRLISPRQLIRLRPLMSQPRLASLRPPARLRRLISPRPPVRLRPLMSRRRLISLNPLARLRQLISPCQLSRARKRSKLDRRGPRRRNPRSIRRSIPRRILRTMSTISHDQNAHRFTTEVEGHRAELDYTVAGSVMTITHTRVPQAIGGRGVAAQLMQAALQFAKERGWSVDPACTYAAAYMRRLGLQPSKSHMDDLLDEALDESFPASDSPSVGGSN
jgi:uncharacterized protein